MERLSTKLTGRLKGIRAYPVGLCADDVARLTLTTDLVDDILKCLGSTETIDQQVALLFAEVLVWPAKIAQDDRRKFVDRMVEISRGPAAQTHAPCYKLLVRFRSEVPNYRSLMLEALNNSDPMVRKEALLAYATYCQRRDVTPLEVFEDDKYTAEISLGGPLIYELRNLALETIESVIGRIFDKIENTEALSNGNVVFWWDWKPYHAWKNRWSKKFF